MDRETSQGLGPFLVLSDSTLQYMLRENSYGAYPLFEGYVLSCPGGLEHQHKDCTLHPGAAALAVWTPEGLPGGLPVPAGRQHAAGPSGHAAKPPVYSAVKEPPARTREKLRFPH